MRDVSSTYLIQIKRFTANQDTSYRLFTTNPLGYIRLLNSDCNTSEPPTAYFLSEKAAFETRSVEREFRVAEFTMVNEQRRNVPFGRDRPKAAFSDRKSEPRLIDPLPSGRGGQALIQLPTKNEDKIHTENEPE